MIKNEDEKERKKEKSWNTRGHKLFTINSVHGVVVYDKSATVEVLSKSILNTYVFIYDLLVV